MDVQSRAADERHQQPFVARHSCCTAGGKEDTALRSAGQIDNQRPCQHQKPAEIGAAGVEGEHGRPCVMQTVTCHSSQYDEPQGLMPSCGEGKLESGRIMRMGHAISFAAHSMQMIIIRKL